MSRLISLSSTSRIFVMRDLPCGYMPGETAELVPRNRSPADIHGGESDGECGPLARGALDRDVAPHQPAEFPADGQAQARAPVLARRRGIGLRELLEQLLHLLGGHPDAAIPHAEGDPASPGSRLAGDLQRDGPV